MLLLASSSPRRKELLALLGIDFAHRPTDLQEIPKEKETPQTYVKRMAFEKAKLAQKNRNSFDPEWILTADTTVALEEQKKNSSQIFEKPKDRIEAKEFLKKLSGKTHLVYTAFCLLNAKGSIEKAYSKTVLSKVQFRNLQNQEIEVYLDTNDWRDKAGGYGIQGKGAFLIETITGSYTNVVGLPLTELLQGFNKLGITF